MMPRARSSALLAALLTLSPGLGLLLAFAPSANAFPVPSGYTNVLTSTTSLSIAGALTYNSGQSTGGCTSNAACAYDNDLSTHVAYGRDSVATDTCATSLGNYIDFAFPTTYIDRIDARFSYYQPSSPNGMCYAFGAVDATSGAETQLTTWSIPSQNTLTDFTFTLPTRVTNVNHFRVHVACVNGCGFSSANIYDLEVLSLNPAPPDGAVKAGIRAGVGSAILWWVYDRANQPFPDTYNVYYRTTSSPSDTGAWNASGYTYVGSYACPTGRGCAASVTGLTNAQTYYLRVVASSAGVGEGAYTPQLYVFPGEGAVQNLTTNYDIGVELLSQGIDNAPDGPRNNSWNPVVGTSNNMSGTTPTSGGTALPGVYRALADNSDATYMATSGGAWTSSGSCMSATSYVDFRFAHNVTPSQLGARWQRIAGTTVTTCISWTYFNSQGSEVELTETFSTSTSASLISTLTTLTVPISSDHWRVHVGATTGGTVSLNDVSMFENPSSAFPYYRALGNAFARAGHVLGACSSNCPTTSYGSASYTLGTGDYYLYLYTTQELRLTGHAGLLNPTGGTGTATVENLGFVPLLTAQDGSGSCGLGIYRIHSVATQSLVAKFQSTVSSGSYICRLADRGAVPGNDENGAVYITTDFSGFGGTTTDVWGIAYKATQRPFIPVTDASVLLDTTGESKLAAFSQNGAAFVPADYVTDALLQSTAGSVAGNARIIVLGQTSTTATPAQWSLTVNGAPATKLKYGNCAGTNNVCAAFVIDDLGRSNGYYTQDNATDVQGSWPTSTSRLYVLRLAGNGWDTSTNVWYERPSTSQVGGHDSWTCGQRICGAMARWEQTFTPTDNAGLPAPLVTGCTSGNAQVTLTWNAVAGAIRYRVYYATSQGTSTNQYIFWSQANSLTSTVTGLANGVTYHFIVTAVNAASVEGPISNDATCATVAPPAGAPSVALAPGDTQITVTVTPPNTADLLTPDMNGGTARCDSPNQHFGVPLNAGSRYAIVAGKNTPTQHATDNWQLTGTGGAVLTVNKDGTLQAASGVNPKIWRHVNVTAGQWYAEVEFTWPSGQGSTATYACGDATSYGVIGYTYPPGYTSDAALPGFVGVTLIGAGKTAYIFSSLAAGPVSSMEVYRDTASHPSPPTGYTKIRTLTPGTATFTDTGLTNGVTYHYRAVAINPGGTGVFSNDIAATPIAGAPTGAPTLYGDVRGLNLLRSAASTSATGSGIAAPSPTGPATDYNDTTSAGMTPSTAVSGSGSCTGSHATWTYTWASPVTVQYAKLRAQNSASGGTYSVCARLDATYANGTTATLGDLGSYSNGNPSSINENSLTLTTPVEVVSVTLAMRCNQCSPAATMGLNVYDFLVQGPPSPNSAGLWWPNLVPAPARYTIFESPRTSSATTPMNASGDYLFVKTITAQPGTVTETTITGLSSAADYYFRVLGASDGGEGPASNEVHVLTGTSTPSTPPVVTLTPGDTTIGLSWTSVPGASTYSVFYDTSPHLVTSTLNASGYAYLTTTTTRTFSHTSLVNGQSYYYRVVGVNDAGEGVPSDDVTTKPSIPPPPTFTATALNPTGNPAGRGVRLDWTNPTASGFTGVELRRNTTGTQPILLVQLPSTNLTFTDAAAPEGVVVTYTVLPRTSFGTGATTRTAAVLTVSPTPTGLQARAASGTINLSWQDAQGAAGYFVRRNDNAVVFSTHTWYVDAGLALGTSFTYNVSSVNPPGESTPTANVTATVGYDTRTIATGLTATGNFSRIVPDVVTLRLDRTATATTYFVTVARYSAITGSLQIVTTPYEWKGDGTQSLNFSYPNPPPSDEGDEAAYWTFLNTDDGTYLGGCAFQILPNWPSRLLPSFIVPTGAGAQLGATDTEDLADQAQEAIAAATHPNIDLPPLEGVTAGADTLPGVFGFAMVCVIAALGLALAGKRH